ncbi:transporter substrate-binding domain-containing protein [Motilimonas pumila]|uniref:Sensory/regulatory protein RpfC n=1 Tax=Motilimonas pumila TaxID=2303987 RepID=A0A418YKR1_9GAMM|nr:transporter substrate-binding domain-containing protein [Motilimonas pumila]RJG51575.1 response regulator [Motilimonas pumila]
MTMPIIKSTLLHGLFILLFTAFSCGQLAAQVSDLSQAEEAWIDRKAQVIVGVLTTPYQPYYKISDNQKVSGILDDFTHLVMDKLGLKVKYQLYPDYPSLEQGLLNGEIDLIAGVEKTPERVKQQRFSQAFLQVPKAIMVHENRRALTDWEQFDGLTFAGEVGFANQEMIERTLPDTNYLLIDSVQEAVTTIKYGMSDAYVGDHITLQYLVGQATDLPLLIKQFSELGNSSLRFSTAYEQTYLINIINKAIQDIDILTGKKIINRWLNSANQEGDTPILINQAEQAWINANPVVKYAVDPLWKPLDYINGQGKPDGMAKDILGIISEKTGIQFEHVASDSWGESMALFKDKQVSILPAVVKTPKRRDFMLFSQPYYSDPWVLLSQSNRNIDVEGVASGELRVAVKPNSFAENEILKHFPKANIIASEGLIDALDKVQSGVADVAFSNLSIAANMLQEEFAGKLKIVNKISQAQSVNIKVGVQLDEPILQDLVNKALGSISQAELENIHNKWLVVEVNQGVEYADIYLYASVIIVPILLILGIILYSNYRLKSEVNLRRLVEIRAKEAERKVQSIADNIPGAVIQFHQTVDQRIVFTFISKGIDKLYSYDVKDMMREPQLFLRDAPAYERAKVMQAMHDSAANLSPVDIEFQLSQSADQPVWIQVLAKVTRRGGNTSWNGVLVDISERKQQEFALAQAMEKAHQATKAKSHFLAMMSHEIRTPLNGVIGMLELLTQSVEEPEQMEYVQSINSSANNLLHILNDVLDVSKIEAGQLEVTAVKTNVKRIAQDVLTTHANNATSKGLDVNYWHDPLIATKVLTDGNRLGQIISNFLGNAIKFTERGQVKLSLTLLQQVEAPNGELQQTIRFQITDTGIGISPENQKKLFQPFVQAEASTSRKYGGTGLGLTISKMLAQRLGSDIQLTSQEGNGTTIYFDLTLPVLIPAEMPQKQQQKAVVLVDNDSEHCLRIKAYFEAWQYPLVVIPDYLAQSVLTMKEAVIFCPQKLVEQHNLGPVCAENSSQLVILSKVIFSPALGALCLPTNPLLPRNIETILQRLTDIDGLYKQVSKFGSKNKHKPLLTREQALVEGQLILVAEDHPTNQEVIRRQLNMLGYTCDIVENGVLALQALKQTPYSLLITDCHMPEMDGYQLTEKVREFDQQLPIIALTANALSGELERCIEIGMNDYLSKPTSMGDLKEKILQYITESEGGASLVEPVTDMAAILAETDDECLLSEVSAEENALPVSDMPWQAAQVLQPVDELELLEMFGERVVVKQMLDEFQVTLEQDMREMMQAKIARDYEGMALIAHRMKGAASMITAAELSNACYAIEQICKRQSDEDITSSLKALNQAKQRLNEFLALPQNAA